MQNEVERIEKAEEMKELFWNLWKRNKINGLSRFDIEQFDEIVRWASNDFEAFKDVFGKYAAFAAKILTRSKVKMCLKGYAFIATIRDVEFARRCCSNENLWNLAA